MSLVARHLEANGIPTVVLGSAIDIVEYCSVPRYAHVDFPLGNPCGKPFDAEMQLAIAKDVLAFFDQATAPNSTKRLPYEWSKDHSWRDAYARVDESNLAHLQQLGQERRRQQMEKSQQKQTSSLAKIDFG